MPAIWFFITSTIITVGMIRSLPTTTGVVILSLAVLFCSIISAKEKLSIVHRQLLCVFTVLFIYSIITSGFIGRSAVLAFFPIVSVFFFIGLDQAISSQRNLHQTIKTPIKTSISILWSTKLAFLCIAIAHALSLIFLYLLEPSRVSGLMEDYSQAALFILFAFGFTYPILKDNMFFGAVTLILFIGFFTTFSRTANLLLVLFLIVLFIHEKKSEQTKYVIKTVSIICCALAFVYIYPLLIESQSVDRGGLSHFSTLNSRTFYWNAAWEAITQKPWTGYGLGNYEWTGIKEARPFRAIHHIHNDYLQIWHDLGIVPLLAFVFFYFKTIFDNIPFRLHINPTVNFSLSDSLEHYIAWSLLVCLALYMLMSFAITSLIFQVGIVILILDLIHNE